MYTTPKDRIAQWVEQGFWGDKTLCDHLALQVEARPHQLAVIDQTNRGEFAAGDTLRLTYAELDATSDAMALDLIDRGLCHGQRVMVQMPNVVELVVCYFALSKLGVVASPLPVQYQAHEIASLSNVFGTEWFIGFSDFKGTNLASHGSVAVAPDRIITVGTDIRVRSPSGLSGAEATRLAAYRAAHPADANAIFTVCWTSGTTGTPKGVPRSHNMWLASGNATAAGLGFSAGDVLLNPFPMVNMSALGGFLFPATTTGCTLVLHHPLEVPVFLQQIQQESVCFTIAPPALLNRLAKMPELWRSFEFPHLRAIGSGSAPLSPDMIRTFELDYGVSVYNIYGSNEGIALITSPEVVPAPEQRAVMFPGSSTTGEGRPLTSHSQLMTKVVDPETAMELTTPGAEGELCVSGPTVFDGYLGLDNGSVFTSNGFFRTGDLVEIAGEGGEFYRITGRLKDIINRGGMKISPAELDSLLEGYPGIAEVAVCAYADTDLGERVAACIVMQEGVTEPTLTELQGFLRDQGVATFKWPEQLRVMPALPRNPLGKVLRHELLVQ